MNHRLRRLMVITGSLLLAILIYTTYMNMQAAVRLSDRFCRQFSSDTNGNSVRKKTFAIDPQMDSLRKEKSFLLNRIKAAQSDSIVLILDLPDSIAQLELKGVMLYRIKISEIHISRFFKTLCPEARIGLFASPWKIDTFQSTIPKIPVMVKIAPRDTSEYSPDIAPDTTNRDPVHFALETEQGFILLFNETIPDSLPGKTAYHTFLLGQKWHSALSSLKNLAMLKPPDYKPFIRIRLPRRDAKIIFRAIPEKALVVVKM
ncbi:MAG: hypothetical protein GX419_00275 [Bacteroidales bacterium]|nr:hypothetical protein [Bacteroidales bacterium]